MKKGLLLFIILLTFSVGYSQSISVGPKMGVNSSKIILDQDVAGVGDGDRKVGFHAGVFGRFMFNVVYAQPELLYTSSRGEIDIDNFGVRQVQEYKFDQISFPILVGLKIGPMLRVMAGPVGNFMIGAEGEEGPNGSSVMKNYKDATFGYQIGAGVDIGNLLVDLKYEGNFSKFGDGVTIGTQRYAVDQRQNQIILSLGVVLF